MKCNGELTKEEAQKRTLKKDFYTYFYTEGNA